MLRFVLQFDAAIHATKLALYALFFPENRRFAENVVNGRDLTSLFYMFFLPP